MTLDEVKHLIEVHKNELKITFFVKEIGIFGSYVREEQRGTSDVDILVEFDRPVSLLKLVSLENFLSDLLGLKVDVVPKGDVRPELKEQILSEAVYI
jgi:predicted nucleotidyltransferase